MNDQESKKQAKPSQHLDEQLSKRDMIKAQLEDFTEQYGRKLTKTEDPEYLTKDCWEFVLNEIVVNYGTVQANKNKRKFDAKKVSKIAASSLNKKMRLKEQEELK